MLWNERKFITCIFLTPTFSPESHVAQSITLKSEVCPRLCFGGEEGAAGEIISAFCSHAERENQHRLNPQVTVTKSLIQRGMSPAARSEPSSSFSFTWWCTPAAQSGRGTLHRWASTDRGLKNLPPRPQLFLQSAAWTRFQGCTMGTRIHLWLRTALHLFQGPKNVQSSRI